MMGLLLRTCFRGCSKCFYGVIRDATLRKSEYDTYKNCDNKSVILATLAKMGVRNLRYFRSEEFWCVTNFHPKCEIRRGMLMVKTLCVSSQQGYGVGEPSRIYRQPSNNVNMCSIPEEGIPMLGIQVTQSMAAKKYIVYPWSYWLRRWPPRIECESIPL